MRNDDDGPNCAERLLLIHKSMKKMRLDYFLLYRHL